MEWLQDNMFGPPEPAESRPTDRPGRCDDAPVPSERELLWPAELVDLLGPNLLERLYGDIVRRTRLTVKEVCRRTRHDSNHVYRLIDAGALDAVDLGLGDTQRDWRVYRYSLVRLLFKREFRDHGSRCNLPAADMELIYAAVDRITERRIAS